MYIFTPEDKQRNSFHSGAKCREWDSYYEGMRENGGSLHSRSHLSPHMKRLQDTPLHIGMQSNGFHAQGSSREEPGIKLGANIGQVTSAGGCTYEVESEHYADVSL